MNCGARGPRAGRGRARAVTGVFSARAQRALSPVSTFYDFRVYTVTELLFLAVWTSVDGEDGVLDAFLLTPMYFIYFMDNIFESASYYPPTGVGFLLW